MGSFATGWDEVAKPSYNNDYYSIITTTKTFPPSARDGAPCAGAYGIGSETTVRSPPLRRSFLDRAGLCSISQGHPVLVREERSVSYYRWYLTWAS